MSTQFIDEGYVLSARSHGEAGAIVHVLTREHGHVAAHIAGGASRRIKPHLQAGAHVEFSYRARTSEQLGSATIEPLGEGAAGFLDDPLALGGLQAACLMAQYCLPERESHVGAYHALSALMSILPHPEIWPAVYVRFEAGLLEELGFGLDLSACAVTHERDDLIYVSPKSGRAVSRSSGEAYKDKLLKLPMFMLSSQGGVRAGDVGAGLILTGHFLERHVFHPLNKPLPEVRARLMQSLGDAGYL